MFVAIGDGPREWDHHGETTKATSELAALVMIDDAFKLPGRDSNPRQGD